LRIDGPRRGDPKSVLPRFMVAKSEKHQGAELVVAKSPGRGGGPAMRGGAPRYALIPRKGARLRTSAQGHSPTDEDLLGTG